MTMINPKTIIITTGQYKKAQLTVPKAISPTGGSVRLVCPDPLALLGLDDDDDDDEDMDDMETATPRKRQRLSHLSSDEKMMRRKLKNRVAAQTARDRKKLQMSELEEQVNYLQEQNKKLTKENTTLRAKSGNLLHENHELRERLGLSTSDDAKKTEVGSGSAASTVPLPKEQVQALSYWINHYTALVMTLTIATFLTSCNNSMSLQKNLKKLNAELVDAHQPELSQKRLQAPWWGPQQQSWNPSMNS